MTLSKLARSVAQYANERALLLPDDRPLVALSGGVDSCALLLLLVEAGAAGLLPKPVGVAHFHHGMRGRDADADAGFCARLATKVGLPCVIELGALSGANEADAREARYAFLVAAAEERGATVVVTAHHADDQAETVLLRLLRGTSVDGLAAIPPRRALTERVAVARPLLGCRRGELEAYCQMRGTTPRHDPTNENPRYPRTRVRRLLPELEEGFNPRMVEALGRLAESASADSALLRELAEALWSAAVLSETPLRLAISPLRTAPSALLRRVLYRALWEVCASEREARATEAWVARLERLLDGGGGVWDLPGGVRARAWGEVLALGAEPLPPLRGRLQSWVAAPLLPEERRRRALKIDCGTIPENLRVEVATEGERIAPLGMGGKTRLVRDLLREAGAAPEARRGWPLVVDETGTVLWVVGVAQAEQTRVEPGTELALILEWIPEGEV